MSAHTHTPGPWVVDGGQQSWACDKGTIETVLGGGDGETVVASLSTGSGISDNAASRAQTKADARLIAAAPDLLNACEEVLAAHNGANGRSIGQVAGMVRAAIAKARGA